MKSKSKALSKSDIKKVKKVFPEWKLDKKEVKATRSFGFQKHIDALIFIARTTVNAEIIKHYPEISFSYCKVKISISTQEVKALTKQDIVLLRRIEKLYTTQQGDNEAE